MHKKHVQILGALTLALLAQTALGQCKVDFVRDVQPIFKANCFGYHGPSQQMAGLRLDQRSSAIKAGTRRIVPGGSANSFVYLKLVARPLGDRRFRRLVHFAANKLTLSRIGSIRARTGQMNSLEMHRLRRPIPLQHA